MQTLALFVAAAALLCNSAQARVLTGSGSGSGSGKFNIFVGPDGCQQPAVGVTYVRGFPSSPFRLSQDQLFTQPFRNPASPTLPPPVQNTLRPEVKMTYLDISITEELFDFGIPQCKGAKTPMLLYGKQFPGPLVQAKHGEQMLVRFTNKINPDSTIFPETSGSWGPGSHVFNMCKERNDRSGNPNPGRGRATTVHHHGMPSLAPFDGWAEDLSCYNETKHYVLSHDFSSTYWYHDHALGTTSENTYAGLEGMHIVHPCREPYGLTGVPLHVLQLNDVVFDARPGRQCHVFNDRLKYHHDNLFGDINLVNGVPWPKFTTRPQAVRFKSLTAAVSRTFILKIVDDTGYNVAQDICHIVGSDGGYLRSARRFPAEGLLSGTAYRWDWVCDFSQYAGKSLYLYNQQNPTVNTGTPPFFCYSHVLMRIDVSWTAPVSTPINVDLESNRAILTAPFPQFDPSDVWEEDSARGPLADYTYQKLMRRAKAGNVDRVVEFVKGGGNWLMRDKTKIPSVSDLALGWDTNIESLPEDKKHIIFDDIGQNTVEIWELHAAGGWIHPVHVHLIEFYVLTINGAPVPPELSQVPKDVIQIGAYAGKVVVAARFGPNYGEYMIHCHNGVHEDRDMLRAFLVTNHTSGRTAMTVRPHTEIYKDQGKNYFRGDGADSPKGAEFPTPNNNESGMLAAQRYVDLNLYNAFYPTVGTSEDLALLNDTSVNPWLVTVCPAKLGRK